MTKLFVMTLFAAGLATAPALAGSITYDFGSAGHTGSSTTASEGVNGAGIFQGGGPVGFVSSGLWLGAITYGGNAQNCGNNDACYVNSYTTQRAGSYGNGETGIGQSDYQYSNSNSNAEVSPSRYLMLINTNAINAGYTSSTLSLESLGMGQNIQIYGSNSLNAGGYSLDASSMNGGTLLATLSGCAGHACSGQAQTITLSNNYQYFIITTSGSSSNGFVLSQDILSQTAVPEPATFALVGFAVVGMLALRRSRPGQTL